MNSTSIQQLFNSDLYFFAFLCFFRICLKNPFITYHDGLRIFQTRFKGNFESMTLYSHMALFQPQAIRAKKQTFPNYLAYSPLHLEKGGVLSLRAADKGVLLILPLLLPLLAKRGDVLSLCAVKRERVGVWGCML
jgi:hypothetical protein